MHWVRGSTEQSGEVGVTEQVLVRQAPASEVQSAPMSTTPKATQRESIRREARSYDERLQKQGGRRLFRRWQQYLFALTLATAAIAAPAGEARAQSGRSQGVQKPLRVLVDRFSGDSTNLARAGVLEALNAEDSVDVVGPKVLAQAHKVIDGSPKGYQAAARRLDLSFIIRGKLVRAGGKLRVTVMVFGGNDGRAEWWLQFSAPTLQALRAELKAHFWERFEQARARGSETTEEEPVAPSAPPKPNPKPETEPEHAGESESQTGEQTEEQPPLAPPPEPRRSHGGPVCPWLVLRPSGGALNRTYDYRDEQRGALRGYYSGKTGAPRAAFGLGLFPFSQGTCGGASGLGLSLEIERSIGAKSQLADRPLATAASAERAELEYRWEPGAFTLGFFGGYRGRRFSVAGNVIPDVAYLGVGGGLELGFHTRYVSGEVGGAYLHVLDAGEVGSAAWFPRLKAYGIDARAELSISPTWWFDIVLGGRWAGYFLTLHADPNGVYPNGVARGAEDHSIIGELALRFSVPGRRH